MENNYSFAPKGDHLTIFKGKKKAHTPNGNVLIAYDEQTAQHVIDALVADEDYTSPASFLCYHYTFCDLIAQYDEKTVREDLYTCCRENLEDDPFLMFGKEEADYDAIYEKAEVEMMNYIKNASLREMVAMIVIYCSFDSLILPLGVTSALQGKAIGTEEFEATRTSYIKQLRDYCKEEDFALPKNMPLIVDEYLSYCR